MYRLSDEQLHTDIVIAIKRASKHDKAGLRAKQALVADQCARNIADSIVSMLSNNSSQVWRADFQNGPGLEARAGRFGDDEPDPMTVLPNTRDYLGINN